MRTCACLQEGCAALRAGCAHPSGVCPTTLRPGEGGRDGRREGECAGSGSCSGSRTAGAAPRRAAQPSPARAPELLRNADQWVRLPVSQQLFPVTNARADISGVKQGGNNIAAKQRENWQSLAPGLPLIRDRAWPGTMTNPLNSAVKLAIYENKLNTAAEGDVRRVGSRQKLLKPGLAEELRYVRAQARKLITTWVLQEIFNRHNRFPLQAHMGLLLYDLQRFLICQWSRAESGGQKVGEDMRATLQKRFIAVTPTSSLRSVQPHSFPLCNWDESWGETHFWLCQQMCPSPYPSKHPDGLLISVGSYRCKFNSRTELLSLSHPKTVKM